MAQVKSERKVFSPFITRIDAPKKSGFDEYYIDRDVKTVFQSTGQKDTDGHELGVSKDIIIDKKVSIKELLESQRDSVGVESYMRALALQGDSIENYATQVSDKVDDFSEFPDTLADAMTLGDKSKEAFEKLDPALKGNHTTIEGFLNSLSKESIENYIKGIVEAQIPKKEGE